MLTSVSDGQIIDFRSLSLTIAAIKRKIFALHFVTKMELSKLYFSKTEVIQKIEHNFSVAQVLINA